MLNFYPLPIDVDDSFTLEASTMMRLPRFLRTLTVAGVVSTSAYVFVTPVEAQAAGADAAAVAVDPAALKVVESFFHFASLGRYELARAEAEKIIGNSALPPLDVLNAFERAVEQRNWRVPAERRIELYERLLSWQQVPELKEPVVRLIGIFNSAKSGRAADIAFIEQNIQRLGVNRRAYLLGMEQLKQSGELAVPVMIRFLQDPEQRELNIPIRSALRDLGVRALNPLLAATEMKDWNTLPWIVAALGDLGYDAAVPYLLRLYQDQQVPAAVKSAARQSLIRLNVSDPSLDAAESFLQLAERFYYEKSSVAAEPDQPVAHVWQWTGSILDKKIVPAAAFNEHMALRACEYVLSIDPARGDAVSLWLAAAYRRSAEAQGAADPMWGEDHPAPDYFGTQSGTQHLNVTLARALRDREPAVALGAIQSLFKIAGTANLFGGDDRSLMEAVRYPDRRVRFEAAFAFANSLPQQEFDGQQHIVPIMAEALGQTGRVGVLVLARSQDELNTRIEQLGKAGPYLVRGGTTPQAMIQAGAGLSGVDVIVVSEKDGPVVQDLFDELRGNFRLARAATLVQVTSRLASPYAQVALRDPLITVTDAQDEAGLGAAIEEARKRAGGLPLDEQTATDYALRSASLMTKLATNGSQVLDLQVGLNALLAALEDNRPEVARAAGNVLALLDGQTVQKALVAKALDENTAEDLRIGFLKDLAENAKKFENQLETAQIEALTSLCESAVSLPLKSAAAEAHGALRLSSEHVKKAILNRSKR
jgi:hypothetical protein